MDWIVNHKFLLCFHKIENWPLEAEKQRCRSKIEVEPYVQQKSQNKWRTKPCLISLINCKTKKNYIDWSPLCHKYRDVEREREKREERIAGRLLCHKIDMNNQHQIMKRSLFLPLLGSLLWHCRLGVRRHCARFRRHTKPFSRCGVVICQTNSHQRRWH